MLMPDSDQYIESIYNYCDRWCERCKYTDRCFLFQREVAQGIDPFKTDYSSEESWAYVSKCFTEAIELLCKYAEEEGIDLNNLPEVEEEPLSEKAARLEAKGREVQLEYLLLARAFFEENKAYFEEKGQEAVRWVEMGLSGEEDTLSRWNRINDQAEVIKWYMFFIGAKVQRAAQGLDGMQDDIWESPEQSDANRTARILMVAIDRSIAAWRVLLKVFPEKEAVILQALSLLVQLRRMTEDAFPRWTEAGPDVEW